jgi:hypothetical protein
MSDSKNPLDSMDGWEDLPREAKVAVYEHLREAMAKYRKDAAVASISGRLSAEAMPESMRLAVVPEIARLTVALALSYAIEVLEDADPEICRDCGEYHDPEGPPTHVKDSKDLS